MATANRSAEFAHAREAEVSFWRPRALDSDLDFVKVDDARSGWIIGMAKLL